MKLTKQTISRNSKCKKSKKSKNRSYCYLSTFFFTGISLSLSANDALADNAVMMASPLPGCEYSYSAKLPTVGGGLSAGPAGNFYCTQFHAENLQNNIGILQNISQALGGNYVVNSVHISATYLSGTSVSDFVCSLKGVANSRITISIQNEFEGRVHLGPDSLDALRRCANSIDINLIGCDPFSRQKIWINARCKGLRDEPASHHIKYLIIEYTDENDDRQGVSVWGSGNFTDRSLTTNIEDWLMVLSSPRKDRQHWWNCIVQYNRNLSRNGVDSAEKAYQNCKISYPRADISRPQTGNIQFYIMPVEAEDFFKRLSEIFATSLEIYITAQHFDSIALENLIEANTQAQVTLLLDDAYVVAAHSGESVSHISPQDARRVLSYANDFDHVQIRFLQTNHNDDLHSYSNTVHSRSIFGRSDKDSFYMIGSAQLKDGSFVSNTEQQFIVSGDVAEEKWQWFEELITRSVTELEVVLTETSVGTSK